jgi:hypothetical protein
MFYEAMENFPLDDQRHLRDLYADGIKAARLKNSDVAVTACRSAGPLWTDLFQAGPRHFKSYWTTGITSSGPEQINSATFVNPTFAYSNSGKGFHVCHGTDPALGFHLAKAALPVSNIPNLIPNSDLVLFKPSFTYGAPPSDPVFPVGLHHATL